MNKFKIGDKVTVKENFWEIDSGMVLSSNRKKLVGRTLEIESVYSNGYIYTKQDDSNDDTVWTWDENWVELYNPTITWDNLKWKDVVLDKDGDEQMVLGVLNDVVFISWYNEFNEADDWYHKQELKDTGYTIKQATPTPETESEALKKAIAEVKAIQEEQDRKYKAERDAVTIEIGGIKYNKDEVENALKDLKAQV